MANFTAAEPGDEAEKTLENNRCYSISKLSDWLKHDTWAVHEALCLVCNIEPSDSEILWPPGFEEIDFDTPQAQRISLLNDEPIFSLAPDSDPDADAITKSIAFVDDRVEHLWTVTTKYGLFEIIWRMYNRQKASEQLGTCWRLFYSDPAHADLLPQEPSFFLDWSSRKRIEIKWLDWAKARGHLDGLAVTANSDEVDLDKRERDTLHAMIGALLHKLGIDPGQHGVIKRIVGITEDYDAPIGKTKISEVLRNIPAAKETVQDRKRR